MQAEAVSAWRSVCEYRVSRAVGGTRCRSVSCMSVRCKRVHMWCVSEWPCVRIGGRMCDSVSVWMRDWHVACAGMCTL